MNSSKNKLNSEIIFIFHQYLNGGLGYIWTPLILLKTKKLLLKTIKNNFWVTVHSPKHCIFVLMHCSCPMNNTKGAGKKKKSKRRENNFYPNAYLVTNFVIIITISVTKQINNYEFM